MVLKVHCLSEVVHTDSPTLNPFDAANAEIIIEIVKNVIPLLSLLLLLCQVALYDEAQANGRSWQDRFVFKDSIKWVAGFGGHGVRKWTPRGKRQVMTAIRTAQIIAPGVVERVTAYRPVELYRARESKNGGAFAVAMRLHHGLRISSRLLDPHSNKRIEDTLIHEWAHLIDVASLNETDPSWAGMVMPRMNRVREALRRRGSKYFDINLQHAKTSYLLDQDRQFRQLAQHEGMPALYACTNLSESLAVFVERRVKGFKPVPPIESFLKDRYFSSPYRPDDRLRLVHRAMAFQVDGQLPEAVDAYTHALESDPPLDTVYRWRATAWRSQRKWAEAIDDFSRALNAFRVSPIAMVDIYKKRAQCFVSARDYNMAIDDITRAIEISEALTSELHVIRAGVWKRLRDYDKAIADLNNAIAINPSMIKAYRQRAYLRRNQGHPGEEEKDWSEVLRLVPGDMAALRERARLRKRLKRYEQALADYSAIVAKNPEDRLSLVACAQTRELMHDFSGAVKDYEKLIDIVPQLVHQYRTDRGRCYAHLGKYAEAAQEFDAVIHQKENFWRAYQEKAWLLATCADGAIRDGDEAMLLAEKACDLTKQRQARCFETLAAAQAETGQFETAIQSQSKAIELSKVVADRPEMQERLEMYQSERPYRQTTAR